MHRYDGVFNWPDVEDVWPRNPLMPTYTTYNANTNTTTRHAGTLNRASASVVRVPDGRYLYVYYDEATTSIRQLYGSESRMFRHDDWANTADTTQIIANTGYGACRCFKIGAEIYLAATWVEVLVGPPTSTAGRSYVKLYRRTGETTWTQISTMMTDHVFNNSGLHFGDDAQIGDVTVTDTGRWVINVMRVEGVYDPTDDYVRTGFHVLVSDDQGLNWTSTLNVYIGSLGAGNTDMGSQVGYHGGKLFVSVSGGTQILLGGWGNRVYYSANDGANWILAPSVGLTGDWGWGTRGDNLNFVLADDVYQYFSRGTDIWRATDPLTFATWTMWRNYEWASDPGDVEFYNHNMSTEDGYVGFAGTRLVMTDDWGRISGTGGHVPILRQRQREDGLGYGTSERARGTAANQPRSMQGSLRVYPHNTYL